MLYDVSVCVSVCMHKQTECEVSCDLMPGEYDQLNMYGLQCDVNMLSHV